MTDHDLFGRASGGKPKRPPAMPNGYATTPGTGPAGETCGTCEFKVRKRMGGSFLKCGRAVHKWTSSVTSDVSARSPACSMWEISQG